MGPHLYEFNFATGYAIIFSNQATIVATALYPAMLIRPQPIDSTTSTTSFVQESSSAENDLPTTDKKNKGQGYEGFILIVRLIYL